MPDENLVKQIVIIILREVQPHMQIQGEPIQAMAGRDKQASKSLFGCGSMVNTGPIWWPHVFREISVYDGDGPMGE